MLAEGVLATVFWTVLGYFTAAIVSKYRAKKNTLHSEAKKCCKENVDGCMCVNCPGFNDDNWDCSAIMKEV